MRRTAGVAAGSIGLRLTAAIAALMLVIAVALRLKPPDLLRVGANYAAKIVCSNVFLAGRDPDEVLRVDVQAPGVALLRLMRVSVDRDRGVVRAGLLGFIGDGLAVSRPGLGCAAVPDGNLAFALQAGSMLHGGFLTPAAPPTVPAASAIAADSATVVAPGNTGAAWPDGDTVVTTPALDAILADDALAGPGMRAIVVVHRGRIVAERYAGGFTAATPLLGWSMTKSVLAGWVGLLVKEGRLALDQSAGWPEDGTGRDRIRIADLLSMSSGLAFNESYGAVSDVTRMLYLEPDTAEFARAQPLAHPVSEFWSYSSGTANILSRIAQDAAGGLGAAYPAEKLFTPLGMTSAVIEADEDGTLVGSSYMYATARDWARYGEFLLQGGVWRGREMLPPGYVAMMASPVTASHGEYGHGLVWLDRNSDAAFGIPGDTFWMEGHDSQSAAIIPSRGLVVVRLGLTPARERYRPQPLVKALLDAVR